MSAALATAPPQTPDAPNPPARLSRVLRLVACLIDFGRSLADSLRKNADPAEFRYRAYLFGTTDLAVMLARITRGLRRAAALQHLLLARAKRGCELKVAPVRVSLPSGLTRGPRPKHPPLPLDPTDEEIDADIRRRPVGAVIVEICLDLGMQPGNLGDDMHRELLDAAMYYGGSPERLFRFDEGRRRDRHYLAILRSGAPLPPELQPFPWQQPATGPPA